MSDFSYLTANCRMGSTPKPATAEHSYEYGVFNKYIGNTPAGLRHFTLPDERTLWRLHNAF